MVFAEFLSHLVRLYDYHWMSPVFLGGGVAVFVAGLCGAYCGLSLIFRLRGFPKIIAVLVSLLSLYAVIHCVRFVGWITSSP